MSNRRSQRGIALVASLMFAITVLALATATISSGVAVMQESRYHTARQEAQLAAESGVHFALATLSGPKRKKLLKDGGAEGLLRGTGERAARYDVTVEPAGADGIDNDQDLLVDETDEADMLELTSVGQFDGVRRTVRVTLLARYRTPVLPSATYFADPLATLNFNGRAFSISGHDVDMNGVPTGKVMPGIGVNGFTAHIEDQIRSQQQGNVVGAGGEPSIVQVDPVELQDLVIEGARSANIVLSGGESTYKPPSEGAWGTVESPTIIFGQGAIHISGGASGAGILIVNGDLTITGGFEWRGLIVVSGRVEFKGGGGGKRLVGALVIDREMQALGLGEEEILVDDDSGLEMSGTVDILASEQTVARMSQAFATYTVLNWREGPNPLEEALP